MARCNFSLPCASSSSGDFTLDGRPAFSITNVAGGSGVSGSSRSIKFPILLPGNPVITIIGNGVQGYSDLGYGVYGYSDKGGTGIYGEGATGVYGYSKRELSPQNQGSVGVWGEIDGVGYGVYGINNATSGSGVLGTGPNIGVVGTCGSAGGGTAVYGAGGSTTSNTGVAGSSGSGFGVIGQSDRGTGVAGKSNNIGVLGMTGFSDSLEGIDLKDVAVAGINTSLGTGVFARSQSGVALRVRSEVGIFGNVVCAEFEKGTVRIFENLNVDKTVTAGVIIGFKLFKIDHPLDPTNKYLYHACVESPERKNVYDGVVILDDCGEAVVELPGWFEAVNCDFRYQLTCIGSFADVYIAEEINSNHFKISGGSPRMKISWQVTGVRHDPLAQANPMVVEEDKPAYERGYYQNPEVYGQPEEMNFRWVHNSERMRQLGEQQQNTPNLPELPIIPTPFIPQRENSMPPQT